MSARIPAANRAVADRAEEWIDVPFVWQQRVRRGCDCKGLIAGIAAELGRPEADSLEALAGDYAGRVPLRRLRAGMDALFDAVAPEGLLPGDVLLLRYDGLPQHLAIHAPQPGEPDRMIEALPQPRGPGRVRPSTRQSDALVQVYRWREESVHRPAAEGTDRTNVRTSSSMPPVGHVPASPAREDT